MDAERKRALRRWCLEHPLQLLSLSLGSPILIFEISQFVRRVFEAFAR